MPPRPSASTTTGLAPSARTTPLSVAFLAHQPADHLSADQETRQSRNEPEHPDGNRLRSDDALRLGRRRRPGLGPRGRPKVGDDLGDSRDDPRFVLRAAAEVQRLVGVEGAAGGQLLRESGRDDRQLVAERLAVVDHDLGGVFDEADESERDDAGGGSLGYPVKPGVTTCAEVKKATRRWEPSCRPREVAAPGDSMSSSGSRGLARAARQHGHPVRHEVLALRAALEARRRLTGDPRNEALPEHLQRAVETDDRDSLLHPRDAGDGLVHPRGIPDPRNWFELTEDLCILGVRAGQVGGERGLGAPGPGQGRERDASHQADQHHQREVPGAAPTERGPEAVGGLADDDSDQTRSSLPSPQSTARGRPPASPTIPAPVWRNGVAAPRWVPRPPLRRASTRAGPLPLDCHMASFRAVATGETGTERLHAP